MTENTHTRRIIAQLRVGQADETLSEEHRAELGDRADAIEEAVRR